MAIFSKLWITKPSRFILGDNSAETQGKKVLTVSREYGILKKFSGTFWGISSVGRAPALQAGGHEFDSRILHFQMEDNKDEA